MYVKFVEKIINDLFGKDNSISVSEYFVKNDFSKKKKIKSRVFIYLVPGKNWIARLIGKNAKTIETIENLIKIKSYLNNCQAIIKIEN